jgi:hypothetical protein
MHQIIILIMIIVIIRLLYRNRLLYRALCTFLHLSKPEILNGVDELLHKENSASENESILEVHSGSSGLRSK